MNSRETIQITCDDVANSLNLFEKLDYGKGKAAAAVVANAVLRQYTTTQLAAPRKQREYSKFTPQEQEMLRTGQKLQAVKSVKNRLGLGLMDSKHYVENHGGKLLAESGRYNESGHYIAY